MKIETSKLGLAGLVCVTLLPLGASGCTETQAQDDENVASSYASFEEFEAKTYREPGTGIYIVDGDTPVDDIKKLEEFYEKYVRQGALAILNSGGKDAKWNDTQKLNLKYCVSTTFGNHYDAVIQAIEAATGAWEAVANVKYVHVSSEDGSCNAQNTNVVFDVRPTNAGGQYIARAFFPGDQRSSTNVLIDGSAFQMSGNPTLTGVLRHELGHTLGFRHEHTRPEAGKCFEDNEWRALTPYDGASVMHYPQCNGTGDKTLNLTEKDKQGVVSVYGAAGGGGTPSDPGNGGGDPGTGGGDPGTPTPPGTPGGTETSQSFNGSVQKGQVKMIDPLDVAAGTTFDVVMTGQGDPDLYVRFGGQPAPSKWDCRPYKTGPNEKCSVTVPNGQTQALIAVYGYAAGQYQLAVTYTKP